MTCALGASQSSVAGQPITTGRSQVLTHTRLRAGRQDSDGAHLCHMACILGVVSLCLPPHSHRILTLPSPPVEVLVLIAPQYPHLYSVTFSLCMPGSTGLVLTITAAEEYGFAGSVTSSSGLHSSTGISRTSLSEFEELNMRTAVALGGGAVEVVSETRISCRGAVEVSDKQDAARQGCSVARAASMSSVDTGDGSRGSRVVPMVRGFAVPAETSEDERDMRASFEV